MSDSVCLNHPQTVDSAAVSPFLCAYQEGGEVGSEGYEAVDREIGQSRLGSFVEQLLNIGSGFILSFLIWQFVVIPVWNLQTNVAENLQITSLFTVVSVIRGYCWRRLFNARQVRRA